ncbi:MAG: two-component regulator propeller domain-containing protein [Bacteroidota bacterium]
MRKHIQRLSHLMIVLLLLTHLSASAQDSFGFKYLNKKQGLSSDEIYSLEQDSEGFIWIGTETGLNRYDGYHFKRFYFDVNDPQSLSGNNISAILEDSKKRLWVSSFTGLNLMDKETGRFKRIPFQDESGKSYSANVVSIYEDQHNQIWITTEPQGLFKIEETDGQFLGVPFAYRAKLDSFNLALPLERVAHADNEYMWTLTLRGIDRVHLQTKEIDHFLIPNESTILSNALRAKDVYTNDGFIFFIRANRVFCLDTKAINPKIISFNEYLTQRSIDPLKEVIHDKILLDANDNLIFVTKKELIFFDRQTGA